MLLFSQPLLVACVLLCTFVALLLMKMSAEINRTIAEYETSAFTTVSEAFVIIAALTAFALNSCFLVCVWKVTTFTCGLRAFFINSGVSACISALGALSEQTTNVILRTFRINSVAESICHISRFTYAVPTHVISYQLAAIAAERLIVLIRLQRHQMIAPPGWCYLFVVGLEWAIAGILVGVSLQFSQMRLPLCSISFRLVRAPSVSAIYCRNSKISKWQK